jgi:hypothetical protein
MGKLRNSPSAQTTKLSDPFSAMHKWQRLKRMKFNSNSNSNIKNRYGNAKGICKHLQMPLNKSPPMPLCRHPEPEVQVGRSPFNFGFIDLATLTPAKQFPQPVHINGSRNIWHWRTR